MPHPRRIAAVTAALVVAGAVAGAIAAVLGLGAMAAAAAVKAGDPSVLFWGEAYAYAAVTGAALGAVLGPAVAWTLLRRVPVGAAVLGVGAGAVTGALGGLLAQAAAPGFVAGWLWGALAGVAVAGVALRRRYRPGTGAVAATPPNVALQATPYAGLPAALPHTPSQAAADPPAERRA